MAQNDDKLLGKPLMSPDWIQFPTINNNGVSKFQGRGIEDLLRNMAEQQATWNNQFNSSTSARQRGYAGATTSSIPTAEDFLKQLESLNKSSSVKEQERAAREAKREQEKREREIRQAQEKAQRKAEQAEKERQSLERKHLADIAKAEMQRAKEEQKAANQIEKEFNKLVKKANGDVGIGVDENGVKNGSFVLPEQVKAVVEGDNEKMTAFRQQVLREARDLTEQDIEQMRANLGTWSDEDIELAQKAVEAGNANDTQKALADNARFIRNYDLKDDTKWNEIGDEQMKDLAQDYLTLYKKHLENQYKRRPSQITEEMMKNEMANAAKLFDSAIKKYVRESEDDRTGLIDSTLITVTEGVANFGRGISEMVGIDTVSNALKAGAEWTHSKYSKNLLRAEQNYNYLKQKYTREAREKKGSDLTFAEEAAIELKAVNDAGFKLGMLVTNIGNAATALIPGGVAAKGVSVLGKVAKVSPKVKAVIAGSVGSAAVAAADAASGAADEILALDFNDDKVYNAVKENYIQKNGTNGWAELERKYGSRDAIKSHFRETASRIAGVLTGGLSGAIGGFTGAFGGGFTTIENTVASMIARTGMPFSVWNGVKTMTGNFVTEAFEEAYTQFFSNYAIQSTVDSEKNLMEGVAGAAAIGGAMGVAMGVGASGVNRIINGIQKNNITEGINDTIDINNFVQAGQLDYQAYKAAVEQELSRIGSFTDENGNVNGDYNRMMQQTFYNTYLDIEEVRNTMTQDQLDDFKQFAKQTYGININDYADANNSLTENLWDAPDNTAWEAALNGQRSGTNPTTSVWNLTNENFYNAWKVKNGDTQSVPQENLPLYQHMANTMDHMKTLPQNLTTRQKHQALVEYARDNLVDTQMTAEQRRQLLSDVETFLDAGSRRLADSEQQFKNRLNNIPDPNQSSTTSSTPNSDPNNPNPDPNNPNTNPNPNPNSDPNNPNPNPNNPNTNPNPDPNNQQLEEMINLETGLTLERESEIRNAIDSLSVDGTQIQERLDDGEVLASILDDLLDNVELADANEINFARNLLEKKIQDALPQQQQQQNDPDIARMNNVKSIYENLINRAEAANLSPVITNTHRQTLEQIQRQYDNGGMTASEFIEAIEPYMSALASWSSIVSKLENGTPLTTEEQNAIKTTEERLNPPKQTKSDGKKQETKQEKEERLRKGQETAKKRREEQKEQEEKREKETEEIWRRIREERDRRLAEEKRNKEEAARKIDEENRKEDEVIRKVQSKYEQEQEAKRIAEYEKLFDEIEEQEKAQEKARKAEEDAKKAEEAVKKAEEEVERRLAERKARGGKKKLAYAIEQAINPEKTADEKLEQLRKDAEQAEKKAENARRTAEIKAKKAEKAKQKLQAKRRKELKKSSKKARQALSNLNQRAYDSKLAMYEELFDQAIAEQDALERAEALPYTEGVLPEPSDLTADKPDNIPDASNDPRNAPPASNEVNIDIPRAGNDLLEADTTPNQSLPAPENVGEAANDNPLEGLRKLGFRTEHQLNRALSFETEQELRAYLSRANHIIKSDGTAGSRQAKINEAVDILKTMKEYKQGDTNEKSNRQAGEQGSTAKRQRSGGRKETTEKLEQSNATAERGNNTESNRTDSQGQGSITTDESNSATVSAESARGTVGETRQTENTINEEDTRATKNDNRQAESKGSSKSKSKGRKSVEKSTAEQTQQTTSSRGIGTEETERNTDGRGEQTATEESVEERELGYFAQSIIDILDKNEKIAKNIQRQIYRQIKNLIKEIDEKLSNISLPNRNFSPKYFIAQYIFLGTPITDANVRIAVPFNLIDKFDNDSDYRETLKIKSEDAIKKLIKESGLKSDYMNSYYGDKVPHLADFIEKAILFKEDPNSIIKYLKAAIKMINSLPTNEKIAADKNTFKNLEEEVKNKRKLFIDGDFFNDVENENYRKILKTFSRALSHIYTNGIANKPTKKSVNEDLAAYEKIENLLTVLKEAANKNTDEFRNLFKKRIDLLESGKTYRFDELTYDYNSKSYKDSQKTVFTHKIREGGIGMGRPALDAFRSTHLAEVRTLEDFLDEKNAIGGVLGTYIPSLDTLAKTREDLGLTKQVKQENENARVQQRDMGSTQLTEERATNGEERNSTRNNDTATDEQQGEVSEQDADLSPRQEVEQKEAAHKAAIKELNTKLESPAQEELNNLNAELRNLNIRIEFLNRDEKARRKQLLERKEELEKEISKPKTNTSKSPIQNRIEEIDTQLGELREELDELLNTAEEEGIKEAIEEIRLEIRELENEKEELNKPKVSPIDEFAKQVFDIKTSERGIKKYLADIPLADFRTTKSTLELLRDFITSNVDFLQEAEKSILSAGLRKGDPLQQRIRNHYAAYKNNPFIQEITKPISTIISDYINDLQKRDLLNDYLPPAVLKHLEKKLKASETAQETKTNGEDHIKKSYYNLSETQMAMLEASPRDLAEAKILALQNADYRKRARETAKRIKEDLRRGLGEEAFSKIEVLTAEEMVMSGDPKYLDTALWGIKLSERGGYTAGYYNPDTNELVILADAFIDTEDRALFTVWHESFHKGFNLKSVAEGRGKWEDALLSVEGNEELQKMVAAAQNNYPDYDINTREGKLGLYEEILADVFGAWQSGNWSHLEEKYNTKFSDRFKSGEVRTLWQKIVDAIKSIFGLKTEPNNDVVFTLLGRFKEEFNNDPALDALTDIFNARGRDEFNSLVADYIANQKDNNGLSSRVKEVIKDTADKVKKGLAVLSVSAGANLALTTATIDMNTAQAATAYENNVVYNIVSQNDNEGRPFIIADKTGTITIYDAYGNEIASAPALFGKSFGDKVGKGFTPSGRYDLTRETNVSNKAYGDAVQVLTKDGKYVETKAGVVALHRVLLQYPAEQRDKRLASKTTADNRISLGCINLDKDFYDQHFSASTDMVLYVLPEEDANKVGIFNQKVPPAEKKATPAHSANDLFKELTGRDLKLSKVAPIAGSNAISTINANENGQIINATGENVIYDEYGRPRTINSLVIAENQLTPADSNVDDVFDTDPLQGENGKLAAHLAVMLARLNEADIDDSNIKRSKSNSNKQNNNPVPNSTPNPTTELNKQEWIRFFERSRTTKDAAAIEAMANSFFNFDTHLAEILSDPSYAQAQSGVFKDGREWTTRIDQKEKPGFRAWFMNFAGGATTKFDKLMTTMGIARFGHEADSSIPSKNLASIKARASGAYTYLYKKFLKNMMNSTINLSQRLNKNHDEVELDVGMLATANHILNEGAEKYFENIERLYKELSNKIQSAEIQIKYLDSLIDNPNNSEASKKKPRKIKQLCEEFIKENKGEAAKLNHLLTIGRNNYEQGIRDGRTKLPGGYTKPELEKIIADMKSKYGNDFNLIEQNSKDLVNTIKNIRNFGVGNGVFTTEQMTKFNEIGFKEYVPLYRQQEDPFTMHERDNDVVKLSMLDEAMHTMAQTHALSMGITQDLSTYHRDGSLTPCADAYTNMKLFAQNIAGRTGATPFLQNVQQLYEGTVGAANTKITDPQELADLNKNNQWVVRNMPSSNPAFSENFLTGKLPGLIRIRPGQLQYLTQDVKDRLQNSKTPLKPIVAKGYNRQGELVTYHYYFTNPAIQEEIYQQTNMTETLTSSLARSTKGLTRAYSRLLTSYRPIWNIYNMVRDGFERWSILINRPVKDSSGNLVSRGALTTTYAKNLGRLLSSRVAQGEIYRFVTLGETTTKLQRQLSEAVQSGAINLITSQNAREDIFLEAKKPVVERLTSRVNQLLGFAQRKIPGGQKVRNTLVKGNEIYLTALVELPQITTALASYQTLQDLKVNKQETANRVRDQFDPMRNNNNAVRKLATVYPFVRSTLSGHYNLARTLTQYWKPGERRWTALYLAGGTMICYALVSSLSSMLGDDEEGIPLVARLTVQQLSQGLPIRYGNGIWSAPVGFGANQAMWSFACNLYKLVQGQQTVGEFMQHNLGIVFDNTTPFNSASAGAFKGGIGQGITLTVMPHILLPLAESIINRKRFTGSKIIAQDTPRDEYDSDQDNFRVAEGYKEFAKMMRHHTGIDVRPETWRHLTEGYLSGPLSAFPAATMADRGKKTLGNQKTKAEYFGVFGTAIGAGMFIQPTAFDNEQFAYKMQDLRYALSKKVGVKEKADDKSDYQEKGVKTAAERMRLELKEAGVDSEIEDYIVASKEFDSARKKAQTAFNKAARAYMKNQEDLELRAAAQDAWDTLDQLTSEYVKKWGNVYVQLLRRK